MREEALFQSGLFFSIESFHSSIFIPTPAQNMLKRLAGFKQAGFFPTWKRLIDILARIRKGRRNRRVNSTNYLNSSFRKATMSGNISVIFVVIAMGLGLSLIGFIVERYFMHWILNPSLTYCKMRRPWFGIRSGHNVLEFLR